MRICKLICFQLTVPLQLFNHMVSQRWNGLILVQLTGRSFCPIISRILSYKKIAMTFFVSDPRPFCRKLFSPGILFVSCLVAPGPLVPQKTLVFCLSDCRPPLNQGVWSATGQLWGNERDWRSGKYLFHLGRSRTRYLLHKRATNKES